jgi:hypothetical protein
MTSQPDANPPSAARKYLRYSWLLILPALLYTAFTLFSRWQEGRDATQRAAANASAAKRVDDQRAIDSMGGNRFDILAFYATPGTLRRGQSAQLCYGVSNAKTVRLDPPIAAVWPSLSRCISITPDRTTAYTLTAEDAAGHTKSSSFRLEVR